ncbi:MAG: serine/threonine protein kinase [Pirellulales bacterium]|nr:serine/threonine protein kinase [Pirellulales bacterium]
MTATTHDFESRTLNFEGSRQSKTCPSHLLERYRTLLDRQYLSWTDHYRMDRLLGTGGQGKVYLTDRRGADNFTLPIALKVFSPERYEDERSYDTAMGRIAHVSARVAQIQQDNLIDVHNFVDRHCIRMMEMEWIDGYDLGRLMTTEMLTRTQSRVDADRWQYLDDVIVTMGPVHPRLKPGVAVAIARDCLAALAALHREGIAHGDMKPSNIMLKRTGNAKIIDIGSAVDLENPPPDRTCTPTYAAPEILEGQPSTERSDLASLGYVLIEMLAGQNPFAGMASLQELLEAKRFLAQRLTSLVPREVACNELLMNFCQRLVAPDPSRRFASAEVAEFEEGGAASFLRQLVKGDLASEYDNEIRLWLEELD